MRVFETYGNAKIVISSEDGKTEELLIGGFSSGNYVSNTKSINDAINMIAGKGYELLTACGTDQVTSTYTFVRK